MLKHSEKTRLMAFTVIVQVGEAAQTSDICSHISDSLTWMEGVGKVIIDPIGEPMVDLLPLDSLAPSTATAQGQP